MYDGMRSTSPASAIYFLFIVIIGNYVVLNLFLAILLDQFSGGDGDGLARSKPRRETEAKQPALDIESFESASEGQGDEKSRAAFLLAVHVRLQRNEEC
jgi:Ion transport protein